LLIFYFQGLKYFLLEVFKEYDDESYEALPLSKSGKGNARRAVYQAIQDGAFVMFILDRSDESGRSAYGILKMLWESAVRINEGYILRFRQADLNLEASDGL